MVFGRKVPSYSWCSGSAVALTEAALLNIGSFWKCQFAEVVPQQGNVGQGLLGMTELGGCTQTTQTTSVMALTNSPSRENNGRRETPRHTVTMGGIHVVEWYTTIGLACGGVKHGKFQEPRVEVRPLNRGCRSMKNSMYIWSVAYAKHSATGLTRSILYSSPVFSIPMIQQERLL